MERRRQQPLRRIRPRRPPIGIPALSYPLSSYVARPHWPILLTGEAIYDRDPSPPSSPSTNPPPDSTAPRDRFSDDDDGEQYDTRHTSPGYIRKSVYDSRIEQILCENPEMPILITDAGKNHEGGGSFIVYTMRTGVCFYRAHGISVLTVAGFGSPAAVLRVFFSATDTSQPPSDSRCPADPRETYSGGLCGQTDQGERGHGYYRAPKTHAGRVPEPMSPNEGGS